MDKEGTQSNGQEDKKTDGDIQGFTPERLHRQTKCYENKGETERKHEYEESRITLKGAK